MAYHLICVEERSLIPEKNVYSALAGSIAMLYWCLLSSFEPSQFNSDGSLLIFACMIYIPCVLLKSPTRFFLGGSMYSSISSSLSIMKLYTLKFVAFTSVITSPWISPFTHPFLVSSDQVFFKVSVTKYENSYTLLSLDSTSEENHFPSFH